VCAALLGPGAIAPVLAACWLLALARGAGRRFWFAAALGLALVGAAVEGADGRRLRGSEQIDRTVHGVVVAAPGRDGGRFDLRVSACEPACRPRLVRLSSYAPLSLAVGERWVFDVRLRAPRALANPGRGDGELALWRAAVDARGYVRRPERARRLAPAPRAGLLERLRAQLTGRLEAAAPGRTGLLRALLLGDRSALDDRTWRRLAVTGTTHLFVVSGLHVALVAGAVLLLLRLCGRSVTDRPALGLVLGVAGSYAVLSGFGLPVRRALAMLAALLLARVLGRVVAGPGVLLRVAALLVVVDPLAVLDPGFWLSCLAVAALLALDGSVAPHRSSLIRLLRPQLAVAAVLTVPLLAAFGWVPLLGPLVNLLLVPLVAVVVLPAGFLGLALDLAGWGGGATLLRGLADGLRSLFAVLEVGAVTMALRPPGLLAGGLALAAALALLQPLPRRVRALAALVLGLSVCVPQPRPEAGGYFVDVFDVGQGLAVLVRTRTRALLFDTGGRFGPDADAGAVVVGPALRALGVRHLDLVLVSHGDADHAGGLAGVRASLPVEAVLGPAAASPRDGPCSAPRQWRWDGVLFELLHPPAGAGAGATNRASCVLRVRGDLGPGPVTVIPGDIDRHVERRLAPRVGRTDLMIAPHHGSRTSSGRAWVRHTRPRWVVFAAGEPNAFGHPHPEVVARWRAVGACLRTTGRSGMLSWSSDAPERMSARREGGWRWWRWQDPEVGGPRRRASARDGLFGEMVDHAAQFAHEALLVVRRQEVADADLAAVAAHGDARPVPGMARTAHEEAREQALEDVALVGPADTGLDEQFVVREGQHLLAMGAAHAVPEAAAEDAHLEHAEGQDHPEAVHQERDADREGDDGYHGQEHQVRTPGPGAVRAQHDAPGAVVGVEGDGDHGAGAGDGGGGDASSARGPGPRPGRPVDLGHGLRCGRGR
jgi:competence protein ComEC